MSILATVQYYQALRISEAAGIHWEDVYFHNDPSKSRLQIQRSVVFYRGKGVKPYLQRGFKNDEYKEQPLFPESYFALKKIRSNGQKGLIFHCNGEILTYRQIQAAYNNAFEKAGLPYRSTHVMRHGGCRHIFNETSDLGIAQQHLGNSSMDTTLIYAKRQANALTKFAEKKWENSSKKPELKIV